VKAIHQIRTLADAMGVLDERLKQLNISRSATKNFPGVNSESVNGWFADRSKDMRSSILMALFAGAGLEIWVRPIPRNAQERKRYEAEFVRWMTEANIVVETEEISEPQVFPAGASPVRLGAGAHKGRQ
jgi:hypothetical protein